MIYFDTSALIRAWCLGQAPEGCTRAHNVAEFYCVLTGPGLRVVQEGHTKIVTCPPRQAAAAARRTFARLRFQEVGGPAALSALGDAAEANESGKNIHDWMHCEAARLAKCERIATTNVRDFARMTDLPLIPPEAALTA
jgi:hypothetical protein